MFWSRVVRCRRSLPGILDPASRQYSPKTTLHFVNKIRQDVVPSGPDQEGKMASKWNSLQLVCFTSSPEAQSRSLANQPTLFGSWIRQRLKVFSYWKERLCAAPLNKYKSAALSIRGFVACEHGGVVGNLATWQLGISRVWRSLATVSGLKPLANCNNEPYIVRNFN
jgi:hypothetical protein